MKKELVEYELFPVYYLFDCADRCGVEVSEGLMARYEAAWEEWRAVQGILAVMHEEA
jgi:hypothetical protein